MANTYDRGDMIRVAASFNASGVAVDPASVYMLLRNPLGSVATYGYLTASMTKVGTGAYYVDVVPSIVPANGTWTYRWEGRPDVSAAAGEGAFIIRITPFL